MKKTKTLFARFLTLIVLALISTNFAWGEDPAPLNTVLWAENFAHFGTKTPSAAGTGSGTTIYGNATIIYSQSSTNTKAYNEKSAGGTAPELLLSKASNNWTISGIKTGDAKKMSFTFLSNKTNFSLTCSSTAYVVSGSQKSWTLTLDEGKAAPETIDLTLTNTSSGDNARIDNVELKVTEAGGEIIKHYAFFSVNGAIASSVEFVEGAYIEFPENPQVPGYDFVGWAKSPLASAQADAPEMITAGSEAMGTDNITYYAVFAHVTLISEETKIQTLEYDTWTYSGSTTDKSSYRLFHSGSYIESAEFDLSKLSKVIVYGGTFGGDSYNKLTIGDGTNIWKSVTVSGKSETGTNTYEGGTALSGTGKLRITSKSGSSSSTGVRISKVEIFTAAEYDYSDYCTTISTNPIISAAANIDITADATSGEITYEIVNPATGSLTAALKEACDWLSNIQVAEDKVTFTATVNTGAERSAVITLSYEGAESVEVTVTQAAYVAPAVATPTFSTTQTALKVDTYANSVTVTLNCTEEGAKIYYSLDENEPTTEYSAPIEITETKTIKAVAKKDAMSDSEVASKTYTIVTPLTTMDAIFAASATDGNYWITFNNDVVSGAKSSNAYLTNNSGKGLILYKSGHGFESGDVLNGTVECTLTRFNGSAEITSLTKTTTGLTVTTGGTVNKIETTIDALSGVNTGAYVDLGVLTYNGENFTDGKNTIKPYNTFISLPSLINGVKYNVKGIFIQFGETKEIAPLAASDFEEITATKYDVIIDDEISNGSITADPNNAAAGTEITLTVTPAEHYRLVANSLVALDGEANEVVIEDNKFIMPESEVLVSAEFEEIPTHTATFYVNGVQSCETQTIEEGVAVEFPSNPAAIGAKQFVGWATNTIEGADDNAPEFVTSATMGTANLNFYAVFADKTGEGSTGSVTVSYNTENFPTSYASATTISLSGYNFRVAQVYKNGGKQQWKASDGTIYNIDKFPGHITSIVLNFLSSDTKRNHSVKFGTKENPSSSEAVTASYEAESLVYTYACPTGQECDYFVIKNGANAGYTTSFVVNYKEPDTYSNYCTTIRSFNVKVSESAATGLTTMYVDYATEIPAEAEAWYVSEYNPVTDKLTMTQIEGYVPANTAIIVKGTAGESYDFVETFETVEPIEDNMLSGSTTDYAPATYTTDDGWYYLALSGNFKKYEGENIVRKANKAYLCLTDRPWSSAAKDLTIDWEPTGIESTRVNISSDTMYNINGLKVNENYKGIVIVNGKKYINK